jgi:hypothetical protein
VLDPRFRLLIVRRPDVDHVAKGRVTQEAGTGEGPNERHPRLRRYRLGRLRRGGADLADQGEHLIFLNQAVGILDCPVRFVAVIAVYELEPAPVHPTGRVRFGERREDAFAHTKAQGGGRPFEGCRLTEHDAIIENARFGARGGRHHERRGYAEHHRRHPTDQPSNHGNHLSRTSQTNLVYRGSESAKVFRQQRFNATRDAEEVPDSDTV